MKKERSRKHRTLQTLRIISQSVFFALFFVVLLKTRFPGADYIGRVEFFFHLDPLLAVTTWIAARVFFPAFWLALITLVLTVVFGRFFCGWFCPLGSVHQFFSFVFRKTGLYKGKILKDRHTNWKYLILAAVLAGTIFSLNLVGLLDPFSFLYRTFATAVLPAANHTASSLIGLIYGAGLDPLGDSLVQFLAGLDLNAVFLQSFLIGGLFIGLILLNLTRERFWCRYLCPLGAFLGAAARWNILKLRIDKDKCINCGLCSRNCQTQANPWPEGEWKSSECDYCFTCAAVCPTAAISFPAGAAPEKLKTIDLSRRKLILTSLVGALAAPFFRLSPASARASEKLIRPPGALPEDEFLAKCVKCGECMKVCPTNALQPVLSEAGPEGLWTPMLVPEIGYCEYYCSLCSQVCPTGAIRELTIEEKVEVKIGTSWIDKSRCIPWKFGDPCIVCEEHCPVSPKAIKLVEVEVQTPPEETENGETAAAGEIKTPMAPFIDTKLCIGCGICENKCPVVDRPAIFVTSVGESRSQRNQLLLDVIGGENLY